jgi:hypothetical protein
LEEELCTSDDVEEAADEIMEEAAEEVIEDETNGIEDEETMSDETIDEAELAWVLMIELFMSGIEDEVDELTAADTLELVTWAELLDMTELLISWEDELAGVLAACMDEDPTKVLDACMEEGLTGVLEAWTDEELTGVLETCTDEEACTDELAWELDIATDEEELMTDFLLYVLKLAIFQNWFLNTAGLFATYFLQLSIGLKSLPSGPFCMGHPDAA